MRNWLKATARTLAGAAMVSSLGGCLQTGTGAQKTPDSDGGLFAVLSTVSRPVGEPLPQAPIAGGEILVKGPTGFCVDGRSLRNQASGGFALLASCYVMTGGREGPNVPPAVLTVAAAPAAASGAVPGPGELAAALGGAKVLNSAQRRGVTLLQLADGGGKAVPDADPRHWRGAMTLNGFLLVLGVYGPEGGAMAGQGGSALMMELAGALRAAAPRHVAGGAGPAAEPGKETGNSDTSNAAPSGGARSILGFLR
ncbi:hypothetical protein [Oceanicola sp. 22II-s10i]|uniref:hypothetical protein n=1 Tax=Oceanicola sp. 22II-s10i TaxID=1317116 RepID=UPI000B52286F|nr:hypothetical protein [Oceanicola sp. 22II-s10i]